MTVRLDTRGDGKGHRLLRVDGDDVAGEHPRFVAVHRLAAVAWGRLDGLDDPREIHHADESPGHNADTNLVALSPEAHGRITRTNEQRRRREV